MRLIPGARPTVEDLIRGITVMSGNDAAITIAESISGSERLFAQKMTARMAEIGLTRTAFRNATAMTILNSAAACAISPGSASTF